MGMKLCINCAHHDIRIACRRGFPAAEHVCLARSREITDLVTGRRVLSGAIGCAGVRADENECGPDGKYFEPAPPTI